MDSMVISVSNQSWTDVSPRPLMQSSESRVMSNIHQTKLRATVVIEWENVQLAEHSRCLEMLRRLMQQIDEVYLASPQSGGFEVILLYDSEACSVDDIHQTVGPFFLPAKSYCELRLEPTPGQSYFMQKNR